VRSRVPFTHGDETIVFVEREAAENDGVHNREDRRRCPDAERENEERRGGETPGGTEGSYGSSEIIGHGS
jgi:hypothetical protein